MADQNKKGGGSKKIGSNKDKCAAYRAREQRGDTAKTRRIAKAIKRGHNRVKRYNFTVKKRVMPDGTIVSTKPVPTGERKKGEIQPGWILTERGRAMRG